MSELLENSMAKMSVWGLLASVIIMVATFVFAHRLKNYGIVDVVWSWGFAVLALIYISMAEAVGTRGWVFVGMAVVWSGRLGFHLCVRIAKHHPEEDGRYTQLREEWGDRVISKMFGFYQLQALVLFALSWPFIVILSEPRMFLSPLEFVGLGIFVVAISGESIADHQLNRFKSKSRSRKAVCQEGLWNYSRHPNYFFEWLVWVSFFVFALASPWGWTAIASPLMILWFLVKVTGIPATEEQAIRSKGDAYREYQKTTSAFVPWFKSTN